MFITEQEVNDVHLMKQGVSGAYRTSKPDARTEDFEAGYAAALAAINLRIRNRKRRMAMLLSDEQEVIRELTKII